MQIDAKFEMDRAYFAESYAEWRSGISRYRKHQLALAALAWGAGLGAMLASRFMLLGAGLMLFGVIEIADYVWSRHRWISARLRARGRDPHATVEMRFTAAGVDHAGPTARGHIEWRGIRALRETERGLFLGVGDAVTMYVPKRALDPPAGVSAILRWHQAALSEEGTNA